MINAIKRFFGIHVHTYTLWDTVKTSTHLHANMRIIQVRHCAKCGFAQFKKTDIF